MESTQAPRQLGSRKAWIVGCVSAVLAGFALLVVGLVIAVAIYAKPFIEHRIVDRARERGFEIRIGHFELGWTVVNLHDVDATLVGVRGVNARFDTIEVTLRSLEPVSVVADGVDLQLAQSAQRLPGLAGGSPRSGHLAGSCCGLALAESLRWHDLADRGWRHAHRRAGHPG
jgi:hypothetical protein